MNARALQSGEPMNPREPERWGIMMKSFKGKAAEFEEKLKGGKQKKKNDDEKKH